jgi:hypothetical protein
MTILNWMTPDCPARCFFNLDPFMPVFTLLQQNLSQSASILFKDANTSKRTCTKVSPHLHSSTGTGGCPARHAQPSTGQDQTQGLEHAYIACV